MVRRSVDVERYTEADWAACVEHSRIELHYAKHGYFIRENQILDNMHRLPNVPVRLVHGQLDWICPLESSYLLAQAIDGADLQVLEGVGHVGGEAGMRDALCDAADWALGEMDSTSIPS
jgi:proline iminopeptidase